MFCFLVLALVLLVQVAAVQGGFLSWGRQRFLCFITGPSNPGTGLGDPGVGYSFLNARSVCGGGGVCRRGTFFSSTRPESLLQRATGKMNSQRVKAFVLQSLASDSSVLHHMRMKSKDRFF